MAYLELPYSIPLIDTLRWNGASSFSSTNVGTLDYGAAIIFESPIDGTIDEISWKTNGINAGDMEFRLETVTTDYFPSDTLVASGANTTVTVTAAQDNQYITGTLDTPPSVSKGVLYAAVVRFRTSSMGTMHLFVVGGASVSSHLVGYINTTGSAWTRTTSLIACAVKFGDDGYVPLPSTPAFPMQSVSTETYNNATGDNHRGNAVTIPAGFNCKTNGFEIMCDFDGDADVILFDTDGVTVLATEPIYAGVGAVTTTTRSRHYFSSADVELVGGETYYLMVAPNTTTSISMYEATFGGTGGAFKGNVYGDVLSSCRATDPTDLSDYTISTDAAMYVVPLISAIEVTTGGGGSIFGSAGGVIS